MVLHLAGPLKIYNYPNKVYRSQSQWKQVHDTFWRETFVWIDSIWHWRTDL